MSEKKFPSRQGIRLRQYSRSDKSVVSSDDSHERRQEAADLRAKLKNVTTSRNWAQQQADYYVSKARQYELQDSQEMLHHENESIKFYNSVISDIEKRIKWLTLRYPAALTKKQNYATMKVTRPPGDYE